MRVTAIHQRTIECVVLSGAHAGSVNIIPRIPMASPSRHRNAVKMIPEQFPLKLAFAMTINKAQGQSLDRMGLLLDPEVFSHGQLYIALSRVTQPEGVFLVVPRTNRAQRDGWLKNVVYTEVFETAEPTEPVGRQSMDLMMNQFDRMTI